MKRAAARGEIETEELEGDKGEEEGRDGGEGGEQEDERNGEEAQR